MKFLLFFVIFLFSQLSNAHDFGKFVENFEPATYKGRAQIWDVQVHDSGKVFFAAGETLVMWNGTMWSSYTTDKGDYFRVIMLTHTLDTLYSAGNNTFGRWTRDNTGQYHYTELYSSSEIFWRIKQQNNRIYLQSHENLYAYSIDKNTIIKLNHTKSHIDYLHQHGDTLYAQVNQQLCLVHAGGLTQMPIRLNNRIISMTSIRDTMYMITETMGVWCYAKDRLFPLSHQKTNSVLSDSRVFSAFYCAHNQTFILGTVTDGIYVMDKAGNITHKYDNTIGLQHSTVLSLNAYSEDIWIGLDRGISRIKCNSPEGNLVRTNYKLGSVYCIANFHHTLVLGTNKGLFTYNASTQEAQLIRGTQGQVWDIKVMRNELVVSHINGMLSIDAHFNVKPLHAYAWHMVSFPHQSHLFYSIATDGLMLYEDTPQGVRSKGLVKGYNAAASNIVFDKYEQLWTSAPNGQLIKFTLNKSFDRVIKEQTFDLSFTGMNYVSLGVIDGDAVFYGKNQVYKYDILTESIVEDRLLSKLFKAAGGRVDKIAQYQNKFVYINDNDVGIIERVGKEFTHRGLIFRSLQNKMIPMQFRKVDFMGHKAVLGFVNGVASYDMSFEHTKVLPITVDKISYTYHGQKQYCNIDGLPSMEPIPNGATDLSFEITNLEPYGRVYVKLNEQDWEVHKVNENFMFAYLPSGKHTVQFALSPKSATITIKLNITPPFTSTIWFYILLIALILCAVPLSYLLLQFRLRRFKQRLKERQIANIENQRLALELKERDKRLASFTMNSIQFNNILSDIQTDIEGLHLTDAINKNQLKSILRKIHLHKRSDENWALFEKYFNNIYDGFFNRLKTNYTKLTPNDLKISAYIRLNLSTKEIASLMNISPGSVDTARYRLRIKLNLSATESLSNFIMKL